MFSAPADSADSRREKASALLVKHALVSRVNSDDVGDALTTTVLPASLTLHHKAPTLELARPIPTSREICRCMSFVHGDRCSPPVVHWRSLSNGLSSDFTAVIAHRSPHFKIPATNLQQQRIRECRQ
ncbi:hypothetical protein IF1G_10287 [Cordyceps javanica]|uniref:Uncharacterized protein n=1 Tax=Cordyceps javanica TaxID=43265 RepID=A0A545UNK8_9HYPO|nr:hypothetical protein IF1G_10287 [Cordyceps javanica]TQW02800.1 hypothetical protein IF2G_09682 [Cordyceps javanica]